MDFISGPPPSQDERIPAVLAKWAAMLGRILFYHNREHGLSCRIAERVGLQGILR
jgi:hypothetical protein